MSDAPRRSGADYLAALRGDGRHVYLDGERVDDPLTVAALARPARWVARTIDETDRDLDLRPPTDVAELRASMDASLRVDPLHRVTWESARAMHTVHVRLRAKGWPQSDALGRFVDETVRGRRLVAQCITDAKGDRTVSPRDQADPDAYVRVVDRTEHGVVIRGAKLHVSGAALVDTLLVLPTKAMHTDEPEYAIACAVDVNAPGVRIIAASHGPHGDERNSPFSRRESLPTCTVIFDDVFVPTERVLLDGRTADAAIFVHTIGVWLRAGSTADMADAADRLVGLAALVAEANGTARVPHVRDKIAEMIIYATLVRAGLEAAIACAVAEEDGSLVPNELYANAAKFAAAEGLPTAVRHLQDIAGGAVVSAPTLADAENPEIGPLVDKYFAAGGGMSGRERLRLFHAVRDLSADTFGGYRSVGSLHGAGGLHAQRLVARKSYDIERAKADVRLFLAAESEHADG